MKVSITVIAAILLTSLTGYAQHERAGTNLFPFLSLGYNARAMSMANIGAGMANDIYGVQCNPAALGYVRNRQAMVTFQPILMDVRAGAMGYANPIENRGVLAASLTYLSYGTIDGVDKVQGEIVSTGRTYKPYALTGGVTWSRIMLADMSLGASLKGIYSNLDGDEGSTANGIAIDLGWQYRMLGSRLIYGITLRDFGYLLSGYTEETDRAMIPFTLRAGISYIPQNITALLMAFELEKAFDDYLNYRLALEIAAYRQIIFIRGGFNCSQQDISAKLTDWFNIDNSSDNTDIYQKSNWYIFALGVGINAPVKTINFKIDAALNFRVDWLPPSYTLSLMADF
jgi:hypothetical protein